MERLEKKILQQREEETEELVDVVLPDEEQTGSDAPQYNLMTPMTKLNTAKQLLQRAKKLEKHADSAQALIDYRQGMHSLCPYLDTAAFLLPEGNTKLAAKLKRKIALLEENTLEDEPVFKKPLPIDWQDKSDEDTATVDAIDTHPVCISEPSSQNSSKQQNRDQEILDILNNGNLKAITSLACIGLSRANKIMEYRFAGNTFAQVSLVNAPLSHLFSWKISKM